jgi:hypothetical protein
MSIVSEILLAYLPPKRKTTPSGWTTFSGPCCIHNGESADNRDRAGVIENGDSISYHCFNCGFKASWQPGRKLGYKMRQLLRWLYVPDETITKLSFDALRIKENVEIRDSTTNIVIPKFESVVFPDNTIEITDDPTAEGALWDVMQYMKSRNLYLNDGYKYFWCNNPLYKRRLIIPFYYEGRLVGWTARSIDAIKNPRYLMESQPGYVYGLDEQRPQKLFVIVAEGPIDANHVEGAALNGSEISDQQALMINRLNKDVIVVPDRDTKGKDLMEQAIELEWGVSLPDWPDGVEDINDCVKKYGRLYALYSIVSAAETSPLKIRLRAKKWFY